MTTITASAPQASPASASSEKPTNLTATLKRHGRACVVIHVRCQQKPRASSIPVQRLNVCFLRKIPVV